MKMNKEVKNIILAIWRLENEWNQMHDPQVKWNGDVTFRVLEGDELLKSVENAKNQSILKKALRKKIGWWNYIKYLFNNLDFYDNYTA